MNNTNFKKGFTLVELSIVLVIIGLLIGGILVAQSLIDSTKIQSFTRAIGQYDAGVGVFKDRFGDLPGDNTLFGAIGADGDGTIEGGTTANTFSAEIGGFWADLGQSGMKNEGGDDFDGEFNTAAGGAPITGQHIPEAAIGTNAGVVAFGTAGANFYRVASFTSTSATADALTPSDALAIDLKLDDGEPNLGEVRAQDSVTFPVAAPAATDCASSGTLDDTASYVVTGDADTCQLTIRIGTGTGNFQ